MKIKKRKKSKNAKILRKRTVNEILFTLMTI